MIGLDTNILVRYRSTIETHLVQNTGQQVKRVAGAESQMRVGLVDDSAGFVRRIAVFPPIDEQTHRRPIVLCFHVIPAANFPVGLL